MPAPLGNIFALGNEGGRPAFFESKEDLKEKVIEYFESYIKPKEGEEEITPAIGTKPTITGLALYLGFESRQSFYDYKKNEEFSYLLKKAALYIEMNYEELLESKASTGAIFALKNMGWKDKTEQEISMPAGSVTIKSKGKDIE